VRDKVAAILNTPPKASLLVALGLMLLSAHGAMAQMWSLGKHVVPGGILGRSILRVDYYDSEFGDFHESDRYPTSIDIRTASGHQVKTVRTDARGRFQVQLRPGKYVLTPRTTSRAHATRPVQVNVRPAKYDSVVVRSYTSGYIGGVGGSISVDPVRVTICHQGQTIYVTRDTLLPHLSHGDTIGPCIP